MRAEGAAVAALVAQPVDVDDLAGVGEPWHRDGDVGPVGADLGADLAHLVAGKAPVALRPAVDRGDHEAAPDEDLSLAQVGDRPGSLEVDAESLGAKDRGRRHLGVGDGPDDRVGAQPPVADDVDALLRGLVALVERHPATLVELQPAGGIPTGVDGGAGRPDHGVEGQVHVRSPTHGGPPCGGVERAQVHLLAAQDGPVERDGSQPLQHCDAFVPHHVDLVLSGRHEGLGAPVDDDRLLDARDPSGGAHAVHGHVPGPDDGHPPADPGATFVVGLPQEVQGVDHLVLALLDGALAPAPRAGRDDDVVVGPLDLGEE